MQPVRRLSVPLAPDGFLQELCQSRSVSYHKETSLSEENVENGEEKVVEKKKSRYNRRQWAIFFSICFINVGAAMCYSLQAPFYPQEAERKGMSSTVYGLVFGVFELVDFIACPIYGKNIRLIGPKFMLNAGTYVMSVCCILFGFLDRTPAGAPFVALSFTIRIIEAFGQAGFVTASYAIIAQEFPENVAQTFSVLETCFGVGMIIGPTVGGVLFEFGGFLFPFAIVGTVLLLASFGTTFLLPTIKESTQKSGSLIKLLMLPGVSVCYFSVTAVAFSFGFTATLLEPHLRSFNLTPSVMGLMFIIAGGTYALTATFWGWLADKFAHPKVICGIGAMFIITAFLLLGPAPFIHVPPTLWLNILALVFHGIGTGAEYVAAFLDSNREALANGYPNNIETYGMVSGLWSSGLALGSFIGPSVSGALNDAIGFRNSSMMVVALHITVFLLSFGFYYWEKLKRPHQSKVTEESPLISDLKNSTESCH